MSYRNENGKVDAQLTGINRIKKESNIKAILGVMNIARKMGE